MSELKEVIIDSVRVSLMSPQRVVVLRQVDADRFVPIWVGPYEAEAITVALQEIEMIRPLTHDLLKNVFGKFDAKIIRVEIVSLREEIFYGNIVARVNGEEVDIDSRPSDALALAVRAHVPIFVHESVLEEAGMTPDTDLGAEGAEDGLDDAFPAAGSDDGGDRLSIFEDFIDKLDLDTLDDEDKPDEPSDDKKT
jgi:bifunctional DNase/RNase